MTLFDAQNVDSSFDFFRSSVEQDSIDETLDEGRSEVSVAHGKLKPEDCAEFVVFEMCATFFKHCVTSLILEPITFLQSFSF